MFRDGKSLQKSEEELSIKVRMMVVFQEGGFGEGGSRAPGQPFKFLPGGWRHGCSTDDDCWAECFSFCSLFCTVYCILQEQHLQIQLVKAYNGKRRPRPSPAPSSELPVTLLVVLITSPEMPWRPSGTSTSTKFYNPFCFCKGSSHGSTFTPDFGHLSPLFFFLGQSS